MRGGTGLWGEIWPSRLALEERRRQLAAQAGGLILEGRLFTFQGRHGILDRLFSQMPPRPGRRPLPELAGPLLLHQLLRQPGQPLDLFKGLAAGRRLPHRLWRLLVQVKSAGLDAIQVRRLAASRSSGRLAALAGLLESYQAHLERLGLADEADRLAGLERWLAGDDTPELLAGLAGLEVRQALWLRPLDLRLLAALARRLPVRVCFALAEPAQDPRGVFSLLAATASSLEAGRAGDLEVSWQAEAPGPLADLAASALNSILDGQATADGPPSPPLEFLRPAGRYAEVEALARRALALMESGVPAHQIALVFPDLSLYGPMTADVAGRLGLPVFFRRGRPLAAAPLAQDLLALLALPLGGYARAELARVWESPYLARPLAAWLLGPGQEPPRGAARLLGRAGYVDGRETPAAACLRRAAQRSQGEAPARLELLARACQGLQAQLRGLGLESTQSLAAYALALGRLLGHLELGPQALTGAAGRFTYAGREALAVRDLAAWQGLKQAQQALEQAARQLDDEQPLTPGRCLALWREVLAAQEVAEGQGQAGGVPVLRLEDAQGLKPHTLLMGGLGQGEFPQRPAQHLLARQERLDLGRLAGLPVWRTEDEEYGGQVLRLVLLLSSARQGAVLASPAADANGRPLAPAFVLTDLARRLGQELPAPTGGLYGQLPPLDQALEPLALWGGLAGALLGPSAAAGQGPGQGPQLARAVLELLEDEPSQARRWQEIKTRAGVEQARAGLDLLSGPERLAASDAFGGRLRTGPALGLLGALLADPQRRRLSPSSLETYAACPWSWLAGRLLRLAPDDQPGWDLQGRQEGDWVHRALALFFAPAEFDPGWDQDARLARLERCLDQARAELAEQGRPGHDLAWQARRRMLLAGLGRVLENEWQDLGEMRPLAVEAPLGPPGQEGLTLEVNGGPPLLLLGRLDRLDRGPGRLRLTDYKHTRNEAVIRQGLYPPEPPKNAPTGDPPLSGALQIPIYLAAAAENFLRDGEVLQGRLVNTRRFWQKPGYTRHLQPGDALFSRDLATRQGLDQAHEPNLYNHVRALWQALAGGDLAPRPSLDNCRYCPYGLACRARPVVGSEDEAGEAGDA